MEGGKRNWKWGETWVEQDFSQSMLLYTFILGNVTFRLRLVNPLWRQRAARTASLPMPRATRKERPASVNAHSSAFWYSPFKRQFLAFPLEFSISNYLPHLYTVRTHSPSLQHPSWLYHRFFLHLHSVYQRGTPSSHKKEQDKKHQFLLVRWSASKRGARCRRESKKSTAEWRASQTLQTPLSAVVCAHSLRLLEPYTLLKHCSDTRFYKKWYKMEEFFFFF